MKTVVNNNNKEYFIEIIFKKLCMYMEQLGTVAFKDNRS